jgi:hypothetical protein
VLPSETPQFCFADDKGFNTALQQQAFAPGSIIAAGQNFGCGSSREQAASAIKGHGLVVIARGFARIFLQNSINLGLRRSSAPRSTPSSATNRAHAGHVRNVTRGSSSPSCRCRRPPGHHRRRGLIAYTGRLLSARPERLEEDPAETEPGQAGVLM